MHLNKKDDFVESGFPLSGQRHRKKRVLHPQAFSYIAPAQVFLFHLDLDSPLGG